MEEAKERALKRKARVEAPSSSEDPKTKEAPAAEAIQVAKVVRRSEAAGSDEIQLSFPANFLASSSAEHGVMPHARKLLFPAAKQRIGNLEASTALDHAAGHALQVRVTSSYLVYSSKLQTSIFNF